MHVSKFAAVLLACSSLHPSIRFYNPSLLSAHKTEFNLPVSSIIIHTLIFVYIKYEASSIVKRNSYEPGFLRNYQIILEKENHPKIRLLLTSQIQLDLTKPLSTRLKKVVS